MNKIVRKIFLAVITLILAITTFTGVTFAWLSINSDAWVEGMHIQATTGKGFLVSIDGYNYSSSLTTDDITKAIILKYRKSYTIDEKGNLLNEVNKEVSKSDMNKLFKNIKLDPCTSYGGSNLDLMNINGTKIDSSFGKYIEFDIYFKSTGELTSDMNIYLNGKDKVLHQDSEEYQVNPTTLVSEIDEIDLEKNVTIYDKETSESIQIPRKQKIQVKATNALRVGMFNVYSGTSIVELTDKYDLGSYATNITEYTDSQSQNFDADIVYDAQYDASKNAMFTYSSQLVNSLQPIDYKLMPKTYKTLLDSQGLNTVKVLTLTKEHNVQTVTFKLWLEGWDADCIDGLTKSISVQLSFVQQ